LLSGSPASISPHGTRIVVEAFRKDPSPPKDLILTRASAIVYLSRVTVAPITSTIRGVPSEVPLGPEDGMRQPCAVNLHNLLTIDQKGLGRRLARLNSRRMRKVCRALAFALGCDG
jgi:mRNA interferase MazF